MSSQLQIDQDGLAAGVPGVSRTDGKADGSLVTFTDTSPSGSTEFRLLWTPPGDADAVATLAATGDPKVWTFTPTAGKFGTYLVELARAGELPERRALVMRTPNLGLIIPALSERGYPNASLVNADGAELADNNATDFDDPDLNVLPWAAWWRAMHELITTVDDGAANPAVAIPVAFSTSTTDADPGPGAIGFGSAGGTQTGAAQLFINPVDARGRDFTDFFDDLAGGFVRVANADDWILFKITGVETAAGYYRIQTTTIIWGSVALGANDPFTDGETLQVTFDVTAAGRGVTPGSISGVSTEAVLDSVIAALVALGLITDGR